MCQDAHSSVVNYSSLSDFVSNSLLLFCLVSPSAESGHKPCCLVNPLEHALLLQAPLVGKFSDAYGRRPFLAATFICASFPVMVLCFHLNFGLSMYFYFPAQARGPSQASCSTLWFVDASLAH